MLSKVKPVILTFTAFYLPGYRGGGPIRSIANMVARLSDDFQFLVVTSDRDLHDQQPYDSVNVDSWNEVGEAKVFYASPTMRTLRGITRLLRETEYDVIYLNSFFDKIYTLTPIFALKLRLAPQKSTIVAPRGEFSEGAFKLKWWKKFPFTRLAVQMGLYRGVIWHASTEFERSDIVRIIGSSDSNIAVAGNVAVAPDLLQLENVALLDELNAHVSGSGILRVCFLSRLSPKKNLDFALRVLAHVSARVEFTIYGPNEDPNYWQLCQELIEQLPSNIKVIYAGSVPNEQVIGNLRKHDLFFLPTRGENFGHVFLEAWSAGLVVLVSDQTPWRDLASQQLGWDVSLDSPDEFVRVLELAAKFDYEQWRQMSLCCKRFAHEQALGSEAIALNKQLFSIALGRTTG